MGGLRQYLGLELASTASMSQQQSGELLWSVRNLIECRFEFEDWPALFPTWNRGRSSGASGIEWCLLGFHPVKACHFGRTLGFMCPLLLFSH